MGECLRPPAPGFFFSLLLLLDYAHVRSGNSAFACSPVPHTHTAAYSAPEKNYRDSLPLSLSLPLLRVCMGEESRRRGEQELG